MKALLIMFCIGLTASLRADGPTYSVSSAGAFKPAVETLVCIRHGEKPLEGLGQLTCQGLNRALALPRVLLAKFGAPQFVFAPNPAQMLYEYTNAYCYVRPLATIEPTAIYCGLPVNTLFGFSQISELEAELEQEAYQNATIYIAWEHLMLDTFAQDMVAAHGGDPAQVPFWAPNDFDTIFVIKIARAQGRQSVGFTVDQEGLNNLSEDCPQLHGTGAGPDAQTNRVGFNFTTNYPRLDLSFSLRRSRTSGESP
jgi:hypothetical protein